MTIQWKSVFLSTALAAMILPAAAQSSTDASPTAPAPQPAPKKEQNVQQRANAQQVRIANGIKSGELTTSEATTLEKKEAALNREATQMKKANDGKLSAADRAKLEGQENKLSKQIYQQKRDDQKANIDPTTAAGKREQQQQDRIAQGVASGHLTAAEAGRLENQQTRLNSEARNMRQANGGTLTQADKARLNRQQGRESRNIYRQKHDKQNR